MWAETSLGTERNLQVKNAISGRYEL